MATIVDVFSRRLSTILDIAENVKNIFTNSSTDLHTIIQEVVAKNGKAIVAFDCIAAQGFDCIAIASDPTQLLHAIVDRFAKDVPSAGSANPINIMTKLVNSEYMLDANGSRVCYAIRASVPSQYLMKSFACKNLLTVHGYYQYIDKESNMLSGAAVTELDPLFDYRSSVLRKVDGGKKKRAKTHNEKNRGNIRRDVIEHIFAAVRSNKELAKGIIFVQEPKECSDSAVDIIFSDMTYKIALGDIIADVVAKHYGNTHSMKMFLHADSSVPYEFRLKKYTCILNHIITKQPVYVANMYNIATYTPVPCVKNIVRDTFVFMAHPLVKLRLLYIDMFLMEHKLGASGASHYEKLNLSKLTKTHDEVKTYDMSPTWVGFYNDEGYAKNKYNMKMRMSNPVETILI